MKTLGKASIVCLLLAISGGLYFRFHRKLEGATIQISNGKIKGSIVTSRQGRNFHEFLGIPYAEPPTGELRFEPPRPYKKQWSASDFDSEVYDATYYRQPCIQLSLITAFRLGAEDCLYLNVFTPTLNPSKPLPVMVHFYGGLFMEGQSNIYGPTYFMDEDVVLVTLNYRVGALGFLNTGDGAILGNMGLKDQNMALQWVQANIGVFGGDAKQVTIFGQSAGSAAVHYHMLSPKSSGLFHRAISQSGVALNPWAFTPNPAEQSQRFAKKLNCSTNSGTTIAACLKSKDVYEIIDVHREVLDATRDPITVFVPSAEVESTSAFLTRNPFEIKSYQSKVPWLSGLVSDEGLIATTLLFRNQTLWDMDDKSWSRLAPRALYFSTQEAKLIETVTEKIRGRYVPELRPGHRPEDEPLLRNLTGLFTDRHFHKGIHDAALIHARTAKAPTYLYYYSYPAQFSLSDVLLSVKGRTLWSFRAPPIVEIASTLIWVFLQRALFGMEPLRYGICHADEVHMFFNLGPHDAIRVGHRDYEMSKTIVRTWVAFARGDELEFGDVRWPHIGKDVKYMQIGTSAKTSVTGQLVETPYLKRLEFWNTLGLPNG